jgi:hypothetical protein
MIIYKFSKVYIYLLIFRNLPRGFESLNLHKLILLVMEVKTYVLDHQYGLHEPLQKNLKSFG